MIILKEKADKDVQQHNTEMKELVRIIDHDRKLKEFMGIKGQERQEDPQLVAWRQKKGQWAWFFLLYIFLSLMRGKSGPKWVLNKLKQVF